MDLTNTIRTLRESKGLTQEDLADRFGVTRSNYAYLEGRGNKLTIEQLEKIAGALGVTVIELLTGEGQKVQDSEEVERLRKRNEELEDRIKDKEKIIFSYKDRLATVDYDFRISHSMIKAVYFSLRESIENNSLELEAKKNEMLLSSLNVLERPLSISDKVLEFNIPYVSDSPQYKEVTEIPNPIPSIQDYNINNKKA